MIFNPAPHRRIARRRISRVGATVVCALGSLAGAIALAAGNPPDAQTAYDKQIAACNSGHTQQDKATCVREAGAARDAATKNQLDDAASKTDYKQNAMQRCRTLPDADRKDCEARMAGQGSASGSVGGGGIVRELRTQQVGPAASQP